MKKEQTPMLDPKKKNEQKIQEPQTSGDPNSRPEEDKQPIKEDPNEVPESNDPAGYGEDKRIKKSPYKKEN